MIGVSNFLKKIVNLLKIFKPCRYVYRIFFQVFINYIGKERYQPSFLCNNCTLPMIIYITQYKYAKGAKLIVFVVKTRPLRRCACRFLNGTGRTVPAMALMFYNIMILYQQCFQYLSLFLGSEHREECIDFHKRVYGACRECGCITRCSLVGGPWGTPEY